MKPLNFHPEGRKFRVNLLIDWSRSFVDKNGSFSSNTTEHAKDLAVEVLKRCDMVIYMTDIHTANSYEFQINGGPYPIHNVLEVTRRELNTRGICCDKDTSPLLTEKLAKAVEPYTKGLIVPRHVFFQDYNGGEKIQPAFTYEQVEETFGVHRLVAKDFLAGKYKFIVNAKHMYNGAGLQSTEWMGTVPGVPSIEMNSLTLLKQIFGLGEDLEIFLTGTVTGICVYQSATNTKQVFPRAKVMVIGDACTQIFSESLGINDAETGKFVVGKMLKQVGCDLIDSSEFLKTHDIIDL